MRVRTETILAGALIALAGAGLSFGQDESRKEALARRHAAAAGAVAADEATAGQQGLSAATRVAIARRHGLVVSADEAAGHAEAASARALAPSDVWRGLLDGNRRFVAGDPAAHDLVSRRRTLVQGQHPEAIVLGCSDSRVSPELVFDQGLGDLFVVRTAGNVADPVALGSIEYAVDHLHSKVLIVLGHEKCGAVAAAASGEKMPTPALEAIVRKIQPALQPLRATGERLASLGVEANVRRSAERVLADSPLLAREVAAGRLTLVKAIYRLETGEVVTLE